MFERAEIYTEFITLEGFLKFMNITASGGEAKMVIQDGLVKVNGEVCTQRKKKIYPNDKISFEGMRFIVERADTEQL